MLMEMAVVWKHCAIDRCWVQVL